jgi:cbb3-type cytochrome oxidase subunit 1
MENTSNSSMNTGYIAGWLFGLLIIVIGILNLVLVHPVPAVAYFILSLLYLPPANALLKAWFGFTMPVVLKIALGVVIVMFTLGVSDLGDMMDKL